LAPSSNAHTYRLLIFKELYSVLPAVFCESFCSSAAEEEEYEAISVSRQLLFCYTAKSAVPFVNTTT
jgi:hypothetical protein